MRYALGASLILNLLLAGLVVHNYMQKVGPRPLPETRPDFAKIETELKKALAEPELAELFELVDFKHKEWLCRASIRDKFDEPSQGHWSRLQAVVDRVKAAAGVPGRPAGSFSDPNDPRRFIGTVLEFGYSHEVGYDHRNEFRQPESR